MMLKPIHDLKKDIFYRPLTEQTCFCTVICAFTANSSHLPCVDSADFVQEPEDTTVPSTRATSGQSDGMQREACRGEADVISLKLPQVLILGRRSLMRVHVFVVKVLATSRSQAKRKLSNKMSKEKWRILTVTSQVTFVHFSLCLWMEF